jgi:hypothetical protein
VELEEIHTCVDGIDGERVTEAGQLSYLVVEISINLVDLGMLSIQDILWLPKSAQEVLTAAALLLEYLQEAQASRASPWD